MLDKVPDDILYEILCFIPGKPEIINTLMLTSNSLKRKCLNPHIQRLAHPMKVIKSKCSSKNCKEKGEYSFRKQVVTRSKKPTPYERPIGGKFCIKHKTDDMKKLVKSKKDDIQSYLKINIENGYVELLKSLLHTNKLKVTASHVHLALQKIQFGTARYLLENHCEKIILPLDLWMFSFMSAKKASAAYCTFKLGGRLSPSDICLFIKEDTRFKNLTAYMERFHVLMSHRPTVSYDDQNEHWEIRMAYYMGLPDLVKTFHRKHDMSPDITCYDLLIVGEERINSKKACESLWDDLYISCKHAPDILTLFLYTEFGDVKRLFRKLLQKIIPLPNVILTLENTFFTYAHTISDLVTAVIIRDKLHLLEELTFYYRMAHGVSVKQVYFLELAVKHLAWQCIRYLITGGFVKCSDEKLLPEHWDSNIVTPWQLKLLLQSDVSLPDISNVYEMAWLNKDILVGLLKSKYSADFMNYYMKKKDLPAVLATLIRDRLY